MEGVKYEGYTEAISSAQGQVSPGDAWEGGDCACQDTRGAQVMPATSDPSPAAADSGAGIEWTVHHAASLLSLDGAPRAPGWLGRGTLWFVGHAGLLICQRAGR